MNLEFKNPKKSNFGFGFGFFGFMDFFWALDFVDF
jgi:hypothetical protein